MGRPIPIKNSLINIINEEIIQFNINEVLDKVIKSDYEKILNTYTNRGLKCDVYRFLTKNNFSYDVDFCEKYVKFDQTKLINGDYLPNNFGETITKGIIIGFTSTEIKNINVSDEDEKTVRDPYDNRTNRFEPYEVLGKVAYLIEEYVNNNILYDIFMVEKSSNSVNLKVYDYIFKKIFYNQFNRFESDDMIYYMLKY
jgi:hypothetical protein